MTLKEALDKANNIMKYCKEKHIAINRITIVPKEIPQYPYQGYCIYTNAYSGSDDEQDMEERRMELYDLKPSHITFKALISDSWEVVCECGYTFTTQQTQDSFAPKETLQNEETKMREAFIDREIKEVK